MDNETQKNVNPRVYRRSLEDIIILWSTKNLDESQKSIIEINLIDEDKSIKNLHFISDHRRERVQGFDRNTAIAIIPYKENSLLADVDYQLEIVLGSGNGKIKVVIPVFRFGSLPDSIKDDAKYINQLYGYTKDKKWRKVTLIERDGVFGIPVFIMNLDELLGKHNKK